MLVNDPTRGNRRERMALHYWLLLRGISEVNPTSGHGFSLDYSDARRAQLAAAATGPGSDVHLKVLTTWLRGAILPGETEQEPWNEDETQPQLPETLNLLDDNYLPALNPALQHAMWLIEENWVANHQPPNDRWEQTVQKAIRRGYQPNTALLAHLL